MKDWEVGSCVCVFEGPFKNTEMAEWFTAGYFTMTLQVRRGSNGAFMALGLYSLYSVLFICLSFVCSLCTWHRWQNVCRLQLVLKLIEMHRLNWRYPLTDNYDLPLVNVFDRFFIASKKWGFGFTYWNMDLSHNCDHEVSVNLAFFALHGTANFPVRNWEW